MIALGLLLLAIGVIVLAGKALMTLFILPFKIGFGIAKFLLVLLIGIPILILGFVFAAAVVPLLLTIIPVLILVAIVVAIVAAPFVLAFKLLS